MFETKTIMSKDVISVKRQTNIYEAIKLMVEKKITGLPVLNDDMTLAGMISEKDVLSLLYNIEDNTNSTVEDFMTKGICCFNENDSLIDIAECLIEKHFRRVPILSNGKVVGIITRTDIITFILNLRHK
jgi:CBS domain-containing protein